MKNRTSVFQKIALCFTGLGLACALFLSSGLLDVANAQQPGLVPVYPICPISAPFGVGTFGECHWYDYIKSINDDVLKSFQFAIVTGILNAMQFFTQQIAIDTANWMLNGFQGQGTAFYDQSFGDYLASVALNSANQFLSAVNTYTSSDFGFNLCSPISLDLKLSLGIGKIATLPPPNCTFQTLVSNYESTYRSLEPENLAQTMKQSIQPGGNDISVNISTNQKFLNQLVEDHENNILSRQEGGGLKSVTDFVSGKITTPANVAKDTVQQTNAVNLLIGNQRQSTNSLAFAALSAGLKQIPILAAATFVNTLAVGLLQKFFSALNASSNTVATADLSNPNAQTSNTMQPTPVAITDIVTPNLITADKQDFLYELSTCDTTSRGTWGCSLDDGFVNALRSVTDSGGYTIARAAGIGAPGPSGGNIFLHSDWELIPEADSAQNQDSGCYTRAYCSSNLAKLRFARIISVGWELAANSPFNTQVNGKYVTLEQVVRGFNDCNAQGEIDAQHPWCHLINPGWVLTEPQFQCNLRGYGDTVISSSQGFATRIQECEDVVSCLQRDDHGNCTGGYGYCLSERPVWRFGADECDEKFVSCRTYDTRDKNIALTGTNADSGNTGPQVSYVRNTIDYGSCSADNIGCQYYYDQISSATTDTVQWMGDQSSSAKFYNINSVYQDAAKSISSPRIYFDATVQTCDAGSDGCTKVYAATPGQPALNLVQNGSFEDVSPSDATVLTGWRQDNGNKYVFANFQPTTGSVSVDGGQSAPYQGPGQTINGAALAQDIQIQPLRNYVLSFYARKGNDNTAPIAQVSAYLHDKDGATVSAPGSFYRSTNCKTVPGDVSGSAASRPNVSAVPTDENWNRYTCEFVSNSDATRADIAVRGQNVAIDGVELEEGAVATTFVDGDNISLPVDYLKIAPPELACQGNAQDAKACSNYARVCQQTDAGCQGYTDTGGGDPTEVPATLNANDLCPATCVGYAEYRKQPSSFDLVKDANPVLNDPDDDTIADFIPAQAQQCSAQAAGCEEFTNIESVANGGESTLFLTYARACEKPSTDSQTYFTWEGSDTTGYQLRTWSLVAAAPAGPNAPPKIIQKAGPDGLFKDPSLCTEDSWKTAADPDCRQFYDEKGNVFYRFYSQTVVSTADCRDYRKDNSTFADCAKTSGDPANYNQNTKECVYHILSSQSNVCASQDVSCRAYIGTTGANTVSVYQENFANGNPASPTSTKGATAFTVPQGSNTKISFSTEALQVGDYSLKLLPSNQNLADTFTYFQTTTNTLYSVSFWAKSTDINHTVGTIKVNGNVVGSFTLQADWTRYEVGPFRALKTDASSTIGWWGLPAAPAQTFLDTVNIQRLQDVVYVKKDSWTVPAECDQTSAGIPQPQAMLGCRQYVDRKGRTVDVRQFSHLCRYDTVGCTGYVTTQNSDSPYAQTFSEQGATNPQRPWDTLFAGSVTTTRPADAYTYLVDEPTAHCDASNMSCRAFGQPQFDQNDKVVGTKTVYLKDDVSQYVDDGGEPKMLCRPSELFCDRFVSGSIVSYFRDPGQHSCSWQDKVELAGGVYSGVSIPAGEYSGWFVDGATAPTPCYPNELSNGNTFLNVYSAATAYNGWTSTCPAEQSECTEFRDPNDHSDLAHPQGRSYFFIDNTHLDKTTCAGSVSPFDGCVLFRNMNDSVLSYNVRATYAFSHANDDAPEAPIDCVKDPTNPFCKDVGVCDNNANKTCNTDADCTGGAKCDLNDANLILKVKLDRDCQTWLGCSSGETVYDPGQGAYVDLCENLSVCDALGASGSNFCGHYLDRTPGAPVTKSYTANGFYEPVLRQGVFFDAFTYAKRPVDFGSPDYSSYALPNHYQISDYITRAVGYDMLADAGNIKFSFYHDYRNVTAVPYCNPPNKDIPKDYTSCATDFPDQAYPELNLCQFQQTKEIGYYVKGESPRKCYLSVDTPYSSNVGDFLEQGTGGLNPRNAQIAATKFEQLTQPSLDQPLSEAYPPSECKAYPDATSPFPNQYVTGWDLTKDPPKPVTYAAGYDGVPTCEYGEECSCSYRKVDYSGTSKYYSLYGGEAPEGICSGGTHDGEACIPSQQATPAAGAVPTTGEASSPPTGSSVFCGDGSSCVATQDVTLVRGIYGQCLQRDTSRIIAGSQSYNPCLIWSPAPVLFGQNDVYHYQPTAGYLPPQNTGEYYCVAGALQPKDIPVPAFLQGDDGSGNPAPDPQQWLTPPGQMAAASDGDYNTVGNGFNYDEAFVSDGDCFACQGSDSTFIDGVTALGGDMGVQCEDADDDQDDQETCSLSGGGITCTAPNGFTVGENGGTSHLINDYAGRWITTGRGGTHNYAEYFIPLNELQWSATLLDQPGYLNSSFDHSKKPGNKDQQAVEDSMLERNFAYFNFNAIPDAGAGIIGCGYSQDWVDGVSVDDYDDGDKTKAGTAAWVTAFNQNFTHVISPDSANFVKSHDGTLLQKAPCYYASSYDDKDATTDCYYKYWQVGYRDASQPEFQMQWTDLGGPIGWNPGSVFYEDAVGSQSYFAIRAVFEDTSAGDNAIEADKMDATGNSLIGPWRFVGFWVTAATPGINTERAIYMTLNIGHADICREVAQVVAPDTRNAVPFQDRVWSGTSFNLPLLGVTYSSTNPPFGSAKNTKPIGVTPLFQTSNQQPGTQSALRPPTWISSGATYFTSTQDPVNNWGWLTNLFAKIYRVYNYYDQPVGSSSWACLYGPRQGTWCPDLSTQLKQNASNNYDYTQAGINAGRQYCGYVGICDSSLIDVTQAQPLCNALSGVNRGLPCGGGENDQAAGYHVCHAAPMRTVNGIASPQYTSCNVTSGWAITAGGVRYSNPNVEGGSNLTGQAAADRGGLRCASDAVRYPDGTTPLCTADTGLNPSSQCPKAVYGGNKGANDPPGIYSQCVDVDPTSGEGHCNNGFEHAQCVDSRDCRFSWEEWWNSDKNGPAAYDLLDQWVVSKGPDENQMHLDQTIDNIRSNAPAQISADFMAMCVDTENGSTNYLLHPNGSSYGANEEFDDDFDDLDSTTYAGFDPAEAKYCKGAFFHGGMQPIGGSPYANYTSGFNPFYADWSGADDVQGTYDFPYATSPYAQGNMTDESGSGWIYGNMWWDGVTNFSQEDDGDANMGPSTDDIQGSKGDVDIAGKNFSSYRYEILDEGNGGSLSLAFPGAFRSAVNIKQWDDNIAGAAQANVFIPGHCERPPVPVPASPDYTGVDFGYFDAPYYDQTVSAASFDDSACPGGLAGDGSDPWCGTVGRYYAGIGQAWTPGVCQFGELEGKSCQSSADCAKPGYDKNAQYASFAFCQPVVETDGTPANHTTCINLPGKPPISTCNNTPNGSQYKFPVDCRLPNGTPGDPNSTDPDTDANLCTHNAGYYPEASICGNNPGREECLTGVTQDDSNNSATTSFDPKEATLPTDVTAGLYTPLYLGHDQGIYNGDYRYVSYYTPSPPMIAAPDTTQACPAAGQCPISFVNTFSLENQAEGKVAYAGGQALATIRFYGWATDNQAPLTDAWVDWGDGHIQEVHDAKMKNKKPFCGVSKECQFVPGLTCNSDADCPPAGGKCADVGFCTAKPYVSCQKDEDCNPAVATPGATLDTCSIRTTFGNDPNDCEQNYFQFEHAYACGTTAEASKLQACKPGYCSRDNSRSCNPAQNANGSNPGCAPGDTCSAALAPPGGCYDATNSACRFTPRVELKDAWGWCTGECRIQSLGAGKLGSGFSGAGSSNHILFQNGGCYDGSNIYTNQDSKVPYVVANQGGNIQNTCDPTLGTKGTATNYRPWVVYNGALQLGVTP